MTPEQLKASILQYAIQGKLVEQRPEEGTASKEIEKAIKLKKKLDSNGILKGRKMKTLIPISEESAFDIPESWRWVRLGSITEIFGRIGFRGYTKNDIVRKGEGAITMSPSNINQSTGEVDFSDSTYLSWEKYNESPEIMLEIGDIVLVKTGSSYGKSGVIRELFEKATINPQLAILKYISCDNNFLNWVLKSPYARSQYEQFVTGTSIPTFSQEKLANMIIPIPPLAEQHRIVAKIEELLPYVDRYAEAYEKLEQFNAKFPEDMKKSILQYAIQGKLVEQRPEEGTAEELYQQIQDEKQKLIVEGKIKKEKPLAKITDDETPFDIPESWKWVRLPEVGELARGKSKHRPRNDSCLYEGGGYPFIQTGDVAQTDFKISKWTTEYNEKGLAQSRLWEKGTLCLTIAANIGDVAILDFDACFPDSVVGFNAYKPICDNKFFLYGLMCYKAILDKMSHSTAQKNINLDILSNVAFPLPPIKEQMRIVDKIEELLPYCDRLVK